MQLVSGVACVKKPGAWAKPPNTGTLRANAKDSDSGTLVARGLLVVARLRWLESPR
jgi:hypothetical protein